MTAGTITVSVVFRSLSGVAYFGYRAFPFLNAVVSMKVFKGHGCPASEWSRHTCWRGIKCHW